MQLSINTNIPALKALHQLNRTNYDIYKTVERINTGYRINSAADDPAGLAISSRLKARVAGLKQASKNVQNAQSAYNFC